MLSAHFLRALFFFVSVERKNKTASSVMSKSNGVPLPFVFLLLVSTSMLLHHGSCLEERSFKRPDPLQHFKPYRGGYDIRNKHYWASAAFTGVHGYAIAGIWTLCGVGLGIFLLVRKSSDSSSSPVFLHSNSCYFIIFMLFLLFTLLAMVASGFVIAANQSSFKRTKNLEETIIKVGENARRTIKRVTKTLEEMQHLLLPYHPAASHRLNSTSHQLVRGSRSIRRFVLKYEHSIDVASHTSYIVHLATVSINLVLLVAALVLLLLHWHPGFIIIIFICWILTTTYWVLTGFDYFVHTFANDTCSAFEYFKRSPHNNSLSSIIPCMDPAYSDKIIVEMGSTVNNFITGLNSKIIELCKMVGSDEEGTDVSGVFKICNPFLGAPNYSYISEKCPEDTIPIGDLPNILARFTCYDENPTITCESNGKFLPEAYYNKAWSYSRSIQGLIDIFPDLQSLAQCSFVKEAFSNVVSHQCRPFRASIRLLWSSMLSLSIFMLALVLIYIAKAYQDRGKSFSTCSIIPNDPNAV